MDHCRWDIAMSQRLLDGSNVIATFKEALVKECRNVKQMAGLTIPAP